MKKHHESFWKVGEQHKDNDPGKKVTKEISKMEIKTKAQNYIFRKIIEYQKKEQIS